MRIFSCVFLFILAWMMRKAAADTIELTASKDTMIGIDTANPNESETNNGRDGSIYVGTSNFGTRTWRGLLSFPLTASSFAHNGQRLISATIQLWAVIDSNPVECVESSDPLVVGCAQVYVVTTPWIEGSGRGGIALPGHSTWNHPWDTPGGDFDSSLPVGRQAPYASNTGNPILTEFPLDITVLQEVVVNNTYQGFILVDDLNTFRPKYYTRECDSLYSSLCPGLAPKLVLEYESEGSVGSTVTPSPSKPPSPMGTKTPPSPSPPQSTPPSPTGTKTPPNPSPPQSTPPSPTGTKTASSPSSEPTLAPSQASPPNEPESMQAHNGSSGGLDNGATIAISIVLSVAGLVVLCSFYFGFSCGIIDLQFISTRENDSSKSVMEMSVFTPNLNDPVPDFDEHNPDLTEHKDEELLGSIPESNEPIPERIEHITDWDEHEKAEQPRSLPESNEPNPDLTEHFANLTEQKTAKLSRSIPDSNEPKPDLNEHFANLTEQKSAKLPRSTPDSNEPMPDLTAS